MKITATITVDTFGDGVYEATVDTDQDGPLTPDGAVELLRERLREVLSN